MKITKGSIQMRTIKRAVFALAAGVSLLIAAAGAWAGDHGRRGAEEARIYGIVEKRPQDTVGTWIVNGREVAVTANTRIKEKHGRAEQGAYVKVEGSAEGKIFSAYEIEVKQSNSRDEARIYGIVEKRPQDAVGTWIVNGREVAVSANTRIKEKHGRAEEGAHVEVKGNTAGNAFSAYEIEVKQPRQAAR